MLFDTGPTITSISTPTKAEPLVTVRAGRRRWVVLPGDAPALALATGATLTSEIESVLDRAAEYCTLRAAAVQWVNKQALSRAVIEKRAAGKGFTHEAVTRLLVEFSALGLIDDAGLARQAASAEVARKPIGPSLLLARLERRGIESELAETATMAELGGRDLLADAMVLVRKKLGQEGGVDDAGTRRRIAGLLARRGFDAELAERAITAVMGEAADRGDDDRVA